MVDRQSAAIAITAALLSLSLADNGPAQDALLPALPKPPGAAGQRPADAGAGDGPEPSIREILAEHPEIPSAVADELAAVIKARTDAIRESQGDSAELKAMIEQLQDRLVRSDIDRGQLRGLVEELVAERDRPFDLVEEIERTVKDKWLEWLIPIAVIGLGTWQGFRARARRRQLQLDDTISIEMFTETLSYLMSHAKDMPKIDALGDSAGTIKAARKGVRPGKNILRIRGADHASLKDTCGRFVERMADDLTSEAGNRLNVAPVWVSLAYAPDAAVKQDRLVVFREEDLRAVLEERAKYLNDAEFLEAASAQRSIDGTVLWPLLEGESDIQDIRLALEMARRMQAVNEGRVNDDSREGTPLCFKRHLPVVQSSLVSIVDGQTSAINDQLTDFYEIGADTAGALAAKLVDTVQPQDILAAWNATEVSSSDDAAKITEKRRERGAQVLFFRNFIAEQELEQLDITTPLHTHEELLLAQWQWARENERHNVTVPNMFRDTDIQPSMRDHLVDLAKDQQGQWQHRWQRIGSSDYFRPRIKEFNPETAEDRAWAREVFGDRAEDVRFIDIANLTFDQLPPSWQIDNVASLEDAYVALRREIGEGTTAFFTDEVIDRCADYIHDQWIIRRSHEDIPAALKLPYGKLPPHQQEKDRYFALQALPLILSEMSQGTLCQVSTDQNTDLQLARTALEQDSLVSSLLTRAERAGVKLRILNADETTPMADTAYISVPRPQDIGIRTEGEVAGLAALLQFGGGDAAPAVDDLALDPARNFVFAVSREDAWRVCADSSIIRQLERQFKMVA